MSPSEHGSHTFLNWLQAIQDTLVEAPNRPFWAVQCIAVAHPLPPAHHHPNDRPHPERAPDDTAIDRLHTALTPLLPPEWSRREAARDGVVWGPAGTSHQELRYSVDGSLHTVRLLQSLPLRAAPDTSHHEVAPALEAPLLCAIEGNALEHQLRAFLTALPVALRGQAPHNPDAWEGLHCGMALGHAQGCAVVWMKPSGRYGEPPEAMHHCSSTAPIVLYDQGLDQPWTEGAIVRAVESALARLRNACPSVEA